MPFRRLISGCVLSLAAVTAQAQPTENAEAAEPAAAAQTGAQSLAAARQIRNALIVAGDFVAALEPAERSRALSESAADPGYNDDLMQLARVQAELRDFEAAETNYLAAIASLEGQNSTRLIDPYQGLGRLYINSRRFNEAITVLEHARDLSQRSAGLFNLEQTQLLDDITMAMLGLGDTLAAQELQLQRLENAVRAYGEDDARVAPYYLHLGEYYDNSRLRVSARENYRKALAVQQGQAGGDTDVAASLRRLVRIELLLGDQDEDMLRLQALLEQSDSIDPAERALSLAVLGDWSIVHQNFVQAADRYARAYAALRQASPVQADDYFAKPVMIDFIPPLSAVDRGARSAPYSWGSLVMRFDVTPEGRAMDVETVDLTPAGDTDRAYNRRIRETHFRPRLEDGVPAATRNVEFSHYFRYYVRKRRR